MEKVYIVYHDNGCFGDDHWVAVNKVFISKESANNYAEMKNSKLLTFNPYTKEEWESMNPDYDYSHYLYNAEMEYDYIKQSTYFTQEYELNP